MLRQYELVERVVKYDPEADESLINRAYVFAMRAHGEQVRMSGDPYFSHPVEVAGLLTGKFLDCHSIVAALLHDTVEDTETTLEDIEASFGSEVAFLVDGVTKLSKVELQSQGTRQAENFRKLVLAMSRDIRVLLIKIADRLHNMRSLNFIPKSEKRYRIARETLDLYVPLVERIGLLDWKEELENLCFEQLNPEGYQSIMSRLEYLRQQGPHSVTEICKILTELMNQHGVKAEISGREKSPWSIWCKMEDTQASFEQLSDIIAFRIIVGDKAQCYQALGVVHSEFTALPGRFKDYVSLPKPNGYASVHTGIIGPDNRRIELQIRSREMHEVAEMGVAAHWKYKQGWKANKAQSNGSEPGPYRWLRDILDIMSNASDPQEFIENTRLEMYSDRVFIFSPKGDLTVLPRGATPVDFAFAVHTELGMHIVGAKVNGRMVPLRKRLRNGDQVEVTTSKSQHPNPAWLQFVNTGKARAAIRREIRLSQRDQSIKTGSVMLREAAREANYTLTDKAIRSALPSLRLADIDSVYQMIGERKLTTRQALQTIYPGIAFRSRPSEPTGKGGGRKGEQESRSPVKGIDDSIETSFGRCCTPLPGDRIVGIVVNGKGVTIHRIDCKNLEAMSNQPERWLNLSWNVTEGKRLPGRLNAWVQDSPTALSAVSNAVQQDGGSIARLRMLKRQDALCEVRLDIEVESARHLYSISTSLRSLPEVASVQRPHG